MIKLMTMKLKKRSLIEEDGDTPTNFPAAEEEDTTTGGGDTSSSPTMSSSSGGTTTDNWLTIDDCDHFVNTTDADGMIMTHCYNADGDYSSALDDYDHDDDDVQLMVEFGIQIIPQQGDHDGNDHDDDLLMVLHVAMAKTMTQILEDFTPYHAVLREDQMYMKDNINPYSYKYGGYNYRRRRRRRRHLEQEPEGGQLFQDEDDTMKDPSY